jgi:hypothetical protein
MIANCFYGGLIHCMCPTSFFFSCHYTPASYHTFHKAIIRRIPLDNHDHDHRVRTVLAGTGASSTVAMVHPPRGSYEEMLRPSNNLQPVQSTYDRTNDEMM